MAAFKGYLGNLLEAHNVSPLDYGSELWDPTGISKIFIHHENREK